MILQCESGDIANMIWAGDPAIQMRKELYDFVCLFLLF